MPFTRNIIKPRFISSNLLAYITNETTQAEALEEVGATGYKALKSLAQRREQQRQDTKTPMYPAIAFDNDNDAQEYNDDLIDAEYVTTFRMVIQNEDDLDAVEQAIYYEAAVNLMLVNCPTATLIANTGATYGVITRIDKGFLAIQAGQDGTADNDFYQIVEMKATVSLTGNAHV